MTLPLDLDPCILTNPVTLLQHVCDDAAIINPAIKEIAESAGDFLEWRYE